MSNKYLEKIASSNDEEFLSPGKERVAGGVTTLVGAGLASDQYHRGHLTGRETLYHGSSLDRLKKIREEGLKPNQSGGISEQVGLDKHNKDLVFAEKRKSNAKAYGAAQEGIDKGTLKATDMTQRLKITLQSKIPGMHRNNAVRIDLPTWKQEFTPRTNPEFKKLMKTPNWRLQALMQGMRPESFKKVMFNELQRQVHVNRGAQGIGAEFIRGSGSYKGNSLNEISQYIKANPKRFAAGAGKALAGAGIVGAGAAILAHANKRLDSK